MSGIKTILSDDERHKYQGYECLQCDFDVCLNCLIEYKDVVQEVTIDRDNRRQFRRFLRHPFATDKQMEEKGDKLLKEATGHGHAHDGEEDKAEIKQEAAEIDYGVEYLNSSDNEDEIVDEHGLLHSKNATDIYTSINLLEEEECE